jgi:hypothetical protein
VSLLSSGADRQYAWEGPPENQRRLFFSFCCLKRRPAGSLYPPHNRGRLEYFGFGFRPRLKLIIFGAMFRRPNDPVGDNAVRPPRLPRPWL